MNQKVIGVFTALTTLSAVAHAGSAPKELYGKSITVQWSEARTVKFEFEQRVRNTGAVLQMNIYISSAGRPFVRLISSGIAGASRHEQLFNWGSGRTESAPGDTAAKERVAFEGRSIVVYRQFGSGARRIGINLDGTTCNATVVNGREGGKNIKQSASTGGGNEVLSVQVGAVSCSIREGNVFGQ